MQGGCICSTCHPCLMYINLCIIESSEIVDHTHHKFERMICLKKKTLKGLTAKLAECALLKEYPLKLAIWYHTVSMSFLAVIPLFAVIIEFIAKIVKCIWVFAFSCHYPSQQIGFCQIKTGKVMNYFEYILLINHHSVSFAEMLPECRMQIPGFVRIMKAFDILLHRSRFSYSRLDYRACSHEWDVIVAMQFFQQSAHGRWFYIKASTVSVRKLSFYIFIFFDILHIVDINRQSLVFFYEFDNNLWYAPAPSADLICRICGNARSSLAPYISKWVDGETFGHHFQCREIIERLFAYDHSSCMDRQVIGHFFKQFTVSENVFCKFMMFFCGKRFIYYCIDIGFWQTEYFAEFPDYGFTLECIVGCEQAAYSLPYLLKM